LRIVGDAGLFVSAFVSLPLGDQEFQMFESHPAFRHDGSAGPCGR
jgi:hypothetical protein